MATTSTHFDISDYKLKYYHESKDLNGQDVRLEILMRTSDTLTAKEIGEMTALQLEIQGAQDSIDTAVVKTSLLFSMVDTYDKADTASKKHGNWGEFYTPDSTLYLVIVKTKPSSATEYTTRWSGYITPDSWEESLDYYGSISVTARDNIGHLQDFEFDAEGDADGLISIHGLLSAAADKIALPMTLKFNDQGVGDVAEMSQNGTSMRDMMFNVEVFKGSNWYDVIDNVLGDIGWCLRYTDSNTITVAPLRNMSLAGRLLKSAVPTRPLIFIGGGNKIVEPAYKSIIEDLAYTYNEEAVYDVKAQLDFYAIEAGLPMRYEYKTARGMVRDLEITGKSNSVQNTTQKGWAGTNAFRNPTDTESGVDVSAMALVVSNVYNSQVAHSAKYIFGNISDARVAVQLTIHPYVLWEGKSTGRYNEGRGYLKTLDYQLTYKVGGTTWYYDSENDIWSSTAVSNKYESGSRYSESIVIDAQTAINGRDIAGGGEVVFTIVDVEFYGENQLATNASTEVNGIYLGVKGIGISKPADDGINGNVVRTVNDEKFNVEVTRSAKIGTISRSVEWLTCKNYLNVLYTKASAASAPLMAGYSFTWGEGDGLPLPVLNHLQRLCFHITSMERLEGSAVTSGGNFDFSAIYTYKGSQYLLISGTLDLLTGRMHSGVYRQFLEYSFVWGDRTPEYDVRDGEAGQTGGSSSGSGSSSTGGSSGGGGVYSVDLQPAANSGLAVTGSPITSSGVMTIGPASGHEIPQTDRIVHNDGGDNAVKNIVCCTAYPSTMDSNTIYILCD